MARRRAVVESEIPAETPAADITTAPDDWEWDTVVEESPTRVVFDTVGDVFVGRYVGEQHIEHEANGKDESFDLFLFRGRDDVLYAINKSWKLEEAMEKVSENDWVRITYMKDIPTKRELNPMKDFQVDVRTS